VYLGIVSLAESREHALDLFWQDRWWVLPIVLTFGVQVGLYAFARVGAHLAPVAAPRTAKALARDASLDSGAKSDGGLPHEAAWPRPTAAAGASTAAGGGMSTVAMVACCAHHVTDVLPIVGVSLAATFLTTWKTPLMGFGLAANLAGIAVMLWLIRRDRRRATITLQDAE
jgi:hypothetical protein